MKTLVIGLGYVGLATTAILLELGHRVAGVDASAQRVASLRSGQLPLMEPGVAEVLFPAQEEGRLEVSTGYEDAFADEDPELIFIAVGTPTTSSGIDLTYLINCLSTLLPYLGACKSTPSIVVRSTVTPGTTRREVGGLLTEYGLPEPRFGMMPEFLREGSAMSDARNPDRLVFGCFDTTTRDRLFEAFERLECPKLVVSCETAELSKYASNLLLATLISCANDVAAVGSRVAHADARTACDIVTLDRRWSEPINPKAEGAVPDASTRPVQMTQYFAPGPGFGGSCLPKDVGALVALGTELGLEVPIGRAILETNAGRAAALVRTMLEEVGTLEGKRVALLGLTFKPSTDDVRSTPARAIAMELSQAGAHLAMHDPVAGREFFELLPASVRASAQVSESLEDAIADCEMVVVAAPWADYRELPSLVARATLVVDCRGAFREWKEALGDRYRDPFGSKT